jgi:hypothetical protein
VSSVSREQLSLLFFIPLPTAAPQTAAESLLAGSSLAPVAPLAPDRVLDSAKATRGLTRLKIALPSFHLDNPRLNAALDGTATETHIHVRFYGNFDKLAKPIFKILTSQGLTCYSVWDKRVLTDWPEWNEPTTDPGFAARMSRVTERKAIELRQTEPDAKRRAQFLDAFLKSPEFRAEMAKEARSDNPRGSHQTKTYADHLNCYARWKTGHPSAPELAAVRKLAPKFAALGIAELRTLIGNAPRLLLLTAAPPHQASELRHSADRHGLLLDIEPP